jgi:hypothetical protein
VPSERGENRTVYANPRGTFTAELTLQPTRVQRGSRLVPINTRLEARGDGSLGPIATSVDLAFSGGGRQPLVRMSEGWRGLIRRWLGYLSPRTI